MSKAMYQNQKCPKCGYNIEGHTGAFEKNITPKENDFSLCLDCMALLRYNADLTLRFANERELLEADNDSPGLLSQINAVRMAITMAKQEKVHRFN